MWNTEKGVLNVFSYLLLSKYFVKLFSKLFNMKYDSKVFLHMNRLGICTSKHKALRLIFQLRVHSDEDLVSSKRVIVVFQFILLLLMIMIFFYKKSVLSKAFVRQLCECCWYTSTEVFANGRRHHRNQKVHGDYCCQDHTTEHALLP